MGTAGFAQAPFFSFGPKSAVNFSRFSTDVKYWYTNYRPGFDAGLFFRFHINRFYIQPEALYSLFRTDMHYSRFYFTGQFASLSTMDVFVNTSTINMPVLIGYAVLNWPIGNLRVFAGPRLTYTLRSVQENNRHDFPLSFESTPVNFSGQAGVGVDIFFFTLDVRYDYTFTDVLKGLYGNANNALYEGSLHPGVFIISLGWKIF
jgi:hypothetical protein